MLSAFAGVEGEGEDEVCVECVGDPAQGRQSGARAGLAPVGRSRVERLRRSRGGLPLNIGVTTVDYATVEESSRFPRNLSDIISREEFRELL